jgi:hypothetical protein
MPKHGQWNKIVKMWYPKLVIMSKFVRRLRVEARILALIGIDVIRKPKAKPLHVCQLPCWAGYASDSVRSSDIGRVS